MDYFNNKVICDLIEAPAGGMLATLDEACYTVGRVTDALFLQEMNKKLANHDHFSSRKLRPTDKTMQFDEHFRVTHYAGQVTYSVVGFLDKNKDTLYQDFKRVAYNRHVHTCSAALWSTLRL